MPNPGYDCVVANLSPTGEIQLCCHYIEEDGERTVEIIPLTLMGAAAIAADLTEFLAQALSQMQVYPKDLH